MRLKRRMIYVSQAMSWVGPWSTNEMPNGDFDRSAAQAKTGWTFWQPPL